MLGGRGGAFSQNPEHPVGIVHESNNRAVSNITSLRVDFELSKQVYKDIKLTVFFFPAFFFPSKDSKRVRRVQERTVGYLSDVFITSSP